MLAIAFPASPAIRRLQKEKYKISTTLPFGALPFHYVRTEPDSLSFVSFIYIYMYICTQQHAF